MTTGPVEYLAVGFPDGKVSELQQNRIGQQRSDARNPSRPPNRPVRPVRPPGQVSHNNRRFTTQPRIFALIERAW